MVCRAWRKLAALHGQFTSTGARTANGCFALGASFAAWNFIYRKPSSYGLLQI
jgi:hypothetical protein